MIIHIHIYMYLAGNMYYFISAFISVREDVWRRRQLALHGAGGGYSSNIYIICVYVYIYIYVCVYIYIYIHIIHTYMYMCILT